MGFVILFLFLLEWRFGR